MLTNDPMELLPVHHQTKPNFGLDKLSVPPFNLPLSKGQLINHNASTPDQGSNKHDFISKLESYFKYTVNGTTYTFSKSEEDFRDILS